MKGCGLVRRLDVRRRLVRGVGLRCVDPHEAMVDKVVRLHELRRPGVDSGGRRRAEPRRRLKRLELLLLKNGAARRSHRVVTHRGVVSGVGERGGVAKG